MKNVNEKKIFFKVFKVLYFLLGGYMGIIFGLFWDIEVSFNMKQSYDNLNVKSNLKLALKNDLWKFCRLRVCSFSQTL